MRSDSLQTEAVKAATVSRFPDEPLMDSAVQIISAAGPKALIEIPHSDAINHRAHWERLHGAAEITTPTDMQMEYIMNIFLFSSSKMEYFWRCRVGLKREDEELTGLLTKLTQRDSCFIDQSNKNKIL